MNAMLLACCLHVCWRFLTFLTLLASFRALAVNELMKKHEKAFGEIKNYYNDITHNNLDLIRARAGLRSISPALPSALLAALARLSLTPRSLRSLARCALARRLAQGGGGGDEEEGDSE